jgi:hypothetical protein
MEQHATTGTDRSIRSRRARTAADARLLPQAVVDRMGG